MKIYWFFVAICIQSFWLVASPWTTVATTTLFNGEKVEEFLLENGFRVLLLSRHQAAVLTYQVWFSVGSIDEKLNPKLKKTGLAHLFEHMMFRGTEKYADGEFEKLTAQMGGERQNATTSFNRTNYYESIPSRQLESLMALEADRMVNLKLTQDLFEKEKGAVVGELRLHNDRPSSIASDELMKLVFKTAPYQWTVLGAESEIKGFTLEEAQYFYKTFYAPNNALLVVVGDVNAERLLPLVHKYYGGFKRQAIEKVPIPIEPSQTGERRFEGTHRQATSELLLIAYRIPDYLSKDLAAFSLLGTHLSTGMEARLRKLLVDTGIAVGAHGAPDSRPDLFEFFVQLAQGRRAEEALQIINKEIQSLRMTLILKTSFERALNQELLDVYGDITSNSSMGNILGESFMIGGNYLRAFELIDEYKKLTPKDLHRVAQTYFKPENRSVVIIRPEKKT